MTHLLLNLYRVPDDEADEVRTLLAEHDIAFYETAPHWLGISHGGIWLRDSAQREQAQALLDGYQGRRRERARSEWAAGESPGLGRRVLAQPWLYLLVLLGALAILVIVALPAILLLP